MTTFSPGDYSPPPAAPPPPPAVPPTRRSARPIVLATVVSLVVGLVIGYAAGHSGQKKAAAAGSTIAAASGAPAIATTGDDDTVPSSLPSFEPTPEDTTPPDLSPSDFKITLKIKRKECFGSAGCNVSYRIDPTYEGVEDLDSGSWDVTYVVRGGEDGPQTNTFTITDGQASYDGEEMVSTPSRSTKLTVKVISVETNG